MPSKPSNPSTPPAHRANAGASSAASGARLADTIGAIVCRAIIPAWLLTGAIFKLKARDPNLLPSPVRDVIGWLHPQLTTASLEEFMNVAMRTIFAAEFLLAAAMIFLPRLSRVVALLTLALFIWILGTVIHRGEANCGCFGAGGPSPWVMISADSALFLVALFFAPANKGRSVIGFVVMAVIGAALSFGIPEKSIVIPSTPTTPATRSTDGGGTDAIATNDAPSTDSAQAKATGAPAPAWPPVPAAPKGFYLPEFRKWIGGRLSEQPMMHMIERPLPDGIDQGPWHVVLYSVTCDHCQALLDEHFTGTLATKTMLVAMPEVPGEKPLANRVTDAVKTKFLKGANGPDYVFTPPVVISMVDGVVKSVCEDTENEAQLKATLDAAAAAAPTAPADPAPPKAPATTTPAPGAPPSTPAPAAPPTAPVPSAPPGAGATPSAAGWPPVPAKPKGFYLPEFRKWVGQRLSEQPMMHMLERPIPDGFDAGRWHVVLYSVTCEHCQALLNARFSGALATKTLIAAVPGDAGEKALPNKATGAVKRKFLKGANGPDYVFTPPVVITIVDGVVKAVCEDTENEALLQQTLDAQ